MSFLTSSDGDETSNLFERALPFIEKLIMTKEGLGVVMVLAGTFLRMLRWHQLRPGIIPGPGFSPQITPDNPRFKDWFIEVGFDLPVFEVTLPTVGEAVGGFGLEGEIGRFLANLIGQKLPAEPPAGTVQGQGAKYTVHLSDVFITGGLALFGASALGQLVPKL